MPDFSILLWLTPDDFTRQGGDLSDKKGLGHFCFLSLNARKLKSEVYGNFDGLFMR